MQVGVDMQHSRGINDSCSTAIQQTRVVRGDLTTATQCFNKTTITLYLVRLAVDSQRRFA